MKRLNYASRNERLRNAPGWIHDHDDLDRGRELDDIDICLDDNEEYMATWYDRSKQTTVSEGMRQDETPFYRADQTPYGRKKSRS